MISKRAAQVLYSIIKEYVGKDQIPRLLLDLKDKVPGNQSYKDTILAMMELHARANPNEGDGQ